MGVDCSMLTIDCVTYERTLTLELRMPNCMDLYMLLKSLLGRRFILENMSFIQV